jgi:predicted dehydrogenase
MRSALDQPGVTVLAVCDVQEDRAKRAQAIVMKARGNQPDLFTRGPDDYKRLLERSDIDAVLIVTPQDQHGPQAIQAMQAGKHVASETPAAYTVEECWNLVETKEKTGRRYMLLENYVYARERMMVLNMAHSGALGKLTYGECSYVHDTRNLAYESDGTMAWRGIIARNHRGDLYPTHGLAPMATWLGANRGDRLVRMVSMDTGNEGIRAYAAERFGKDSSYAQPGFFQRRDTTLTMIQTAAERLIVLKYDTSYRPGGAWAHLQGTLGCYNASVGGSMVHIKGRSKGWDPLANYRVEFEHPYWRKAGQDAAKAGHGGGDYFVLREFFDALASDREPPIDVYDAATFSVILPLSGASVRGGGKPMEIPDFTRGAWKTRTMTGVFGLP